MRWPSYKNDKFQLNNYLDKCARPESDFIWKTVTNETHKHFKEFILNLLRGREREREREGGGHIKVNRNADTFF
jgi:hypothetical protein